VRLFAAVDPPAEQVAALAAAVDRRDERLRWVPESQWHVTLAFYGETAESKVETLRSGLERVAARTQPLSLRLAGAGTFPRQQAKARVLWVGLDGDVDALRRLADRCAGAGRRARIAMEDRAFRPHLTVARSRKDPVDVRELVARLASYTGEWWTVTSLRLVHSTLGAQVRHETLAEFTLSDGS
jgi:RNA 2',3'-cyclic 3'-phosphodiesterase